MDLRKRRENGQQIDEKDIKKHRNDVFRLYQIISTEQRIYLPPEVAGDMRAFLLAVEDSKLNLSQIGIQGFTLTDAVDGLKQVYGLTDSG